MISGATRSTNAGTLGKKSRLSVLGTLGGERKKRNHGVEKRGNMSKVGLEVEVLPDVQGPVVVSTPNPIIIEAGGWPC